MLQEQNMGLSHSNYLFFFIKTLYIYLFITHMRFKDPFASKIVKYIPFIEILVLIKKEQKYIISPRKQGIHISSCQSGN